MKNDLSNKQVTAFILLRILIGWHFLYEGIVKFYNPTWTARTYLENASGPFVEFFRWLAEDSMITMVDYLNIFGLMAVGLGLIVGYWERLAAIGGILLLLFYYFSQPPFPGVDQGATEGNYFMVNKNLIEAAALWVLYLFPSGHHLGLSQLINLKKE